MKIATWSVINNEMDYLPDIIPFHLQFVDFMYFLDTGSQDGSLEFLQDWAKKDSKVIVEKYSESYSPDHSVEWREMENPFPEVEIRNFALEQVKKLNSDWLIQLDGDEIFLSKVKSIIENCPKSKSIISHSTINPVEHLNKHPREIRNDLLLYDPHARIWKSNTDVKFAKNPAMSGQFHCIPVQNKNHVYHSKHNEFTSDIFHFHLHWIYGKKMESFFLRKEISDKKQMIRNQNINQYGALVPQIFWNRRKEWLNNAKCETKIFN